MIDKKKADVYRLAYGFRKAILQCEQSQLPITLQTFPNGSCGDASLLLGKYLLNNGYSNVRYIAGWKATKSHAWLLVDDFIVDITADQFPEITESVIVEDESLWHQQFEIDTDHAADFELYDPFTKNKFQLIYNYIQTKIL